MTHMQSKHPSIQQPQFDPSGKHYDRDGHLLGYTDSSGKKFDRDGRLAGRTDAKGNHYDRDGRLIGYTKK